MGFLCNLLGHKWTGCKCDRCGELRDEEHDWNGCTCRICGKVRDQEHHFQNKRCVICGKVLDETQMANDILSRYADFKVQNRCAWNGISRHETDKYAFNLVCQSQAYLEKNEADKVLLAWLRALVFDGEIYGFRSKSSKPVPEEFLPPIRKAAPALMLKCYRIICEEAPPLDKRDYLERFKKLCEVAGTKRIEPSQVLEACREANLTDEDKRQFLLCLGVVDGTLVTPCDFGEHVWEYVEGHTESAEGEASDLWHIDYSTYRCKNCGITETRNTRR